jgi:molybdopterin-containing oxidoreductase family membrane subunit
LPSSWDYFSATWVDFLTLLGSFGLFFTLFFLFIRFVPMVAIAEVKGVLPQANPHYFDHEHEQAATAGDHQKQKVEQIES